MSADYVEWLRREGRIVIVGASLAYLRAAETLRAEGFAGELTLIGDEPYEPYDRPPLSKSVLLGKASPRHTELPHRRETDAKWRLGVAATGLDLTAKRVRLADGDEVEYDRLLIATGVRARPWPKEDEARLDGVCLLRTRDDASDLCRMAEGRAAPGVRHRRRLRRFGDRLGLPGDGPGRHGGRARRGAAGGCARRGDRRGRRRSPDRERCGPAHACHGDRAGGRRGGQGAGRPPVRRERRRGGRGRGVAGLAAQHRLAGRVRAGRRAPRRRLRRGLPRLRLPGHRHRRRVRGR